MKNRSLVRLQAGSSGVNERRKVKNRINLSAISAAHFTAVSVADASGMVIGI
jgi:hypothetical protein